MSSVTLGVSKGSGAPEYHLYKRWIQSFDRDAECIDLSSSSNPDDAIQKLNKCSGLILCGGPDVDPELYEKPEERERGEDIDRARDKFELSLLQRARLIDIPVVAIGRGMQLLNVFLGGSLIVDVPTDKPDALRHREDKKAAEHVLSIVPDSLLGSIVKTTEATVNSMHHQAIDSLSWYLKPVATSPDGIVEAVEWSDQTEKPFLLAVQWHPEQMPYEQPLSGRLAEEFLKAAKKYVPRHRID